MKAEELGKIFDDGKEDILPCLDMSTLRRPNLDQKRVNVDLPIWMIQKLDRQANIIGVTRQSIIKAWLNERIKEEYADWTNPYAIVTYLIPPTSASPT